MRTHKDERASRYCDLFTGTGGDVNLFIVNPGQRTCWHRHAIQTDQFRVIRGKIRFGIISEQGKHSYFTYARPDWKMTITPGNWHGYENIGTEPAYLLMYLSHPYDPSDEEEMSEEFCPWSPAV